MFDESLVIDNINLIYEILKRLNLYSKANEYYDIGLIGLIKAAKKYNPDAGYRFSTYAGRCIINEIFVYIRNNKTDKRKANENAISIETIIYEDAGGQITLGDTLASNINLEEDLLKKDQLELLHNSILRLNEKEQFVINHSYALGNYKKLKHKELSKLLGVSIKTINDIKKRSIKKLRRMMEEMKWVNIK